MRKIDGIYEMKENPDHIEYYKIPMAMLQSHFQHMFIQMIALENLKNTNHYIIEANRIMFAYFLHH